MGRLSYAAIVSCAAAICSGVASAAQTPLGNLGPPTDVTTGTITGRPLLVSTAACRGFAIGDTLMFPDTEDRFEGRFWRDSRVGLGASAAVDHLTGSATAGDWTYGLQGNFNSGISFAQEQSTTGKATITRSDGRTISGAASLQVDPVLFQGTAGLRLDWIETPRCK